ITEADMVGAMKFAQEYLTQLIKAQKDLIAQVTMPKTEVVYILPDKEVYAEAEKSADKLEAALIGKFDKVTREKQVDALRKEIVAAVVEKYKDSSTTTLTA